MRRSWPEERERERFNLESVTSAGKVQRTEAESSRGQIMGGLLVNHTRGVSQCAAGDGKHEVLYRTWQEEICPSESSVSLQQGRRD